MPASRIGAVVQFVFLVADANADRVTLRGLRKPDIYERTMGWRLLGEKVARARAEERRQIGGRRASLRRAVADLLSARQAVAGEDLESRAPSLAIISN